MKKQNGEKALAAAAGISVPLLRYYRARGIGNDAEESAAAVELRQAEILRGAGFSAEAAARILHSEDCLAKETEALLPRVRRTSALFGFLKAHAQDPLPLFCAGLAALPRESNEKTENARKKQQKQARLGFFLFLLCAALFLSSDVLAILGDGQWWQLISHAVCFALLFLAGEWAKYLLAAVNVSQAALLLWSVLYFVSKGQGDAVLLLALRAAVLLCGAVWFAFGKSWSAFFYRMQHR